jgi:signal transduction histidine kinase/CheY-like chemotaxis protein
MKTTTRVFDTAAASSSALPFRIALAAGIYVALGGFVSFLGWLTNTPRLTDWWNGGITIKANAALAFCASATALLLILLRPQSRAIIRILAAFVATVGGLTLFEHISGINLGIDTLLFDEPAGAAATAAPGRMGPPASASFLAMGIALALSQSGPRAIAGCIGLALAVLAISTLSLTGYWYGAASMYTIPRLTGIALQTATMLAAMSIGIMAALPRHQPFKTLAERSSIGNLARRLLLVAFVVPLALGWLRVLGQRYGLYDYPFGAALRTVVEIGILTAVVWWSVRKIRERDLARERAEAARATTELRMERVLEASAVPFSVLEPVKDGNGEIVDFAWVYLNAAAASALQRERGALLGKRISDVFQTVWVESGLFEAIVAVAVRKEVREFESRFSPDQTQRWFKLICSPLDGQVAVWFSDVTAAKLQDLELRAADRRKDDFLATLAHELRNPLAPIRQAASLVNKAGVTDLQRQWCNEVIERQVQHMSLLLDDLIDVSRITRGKLELRKKPTSLHAIMQAAIETSRPLLDKKGHVLHTELPPAAVLVDVDSLRLAQVVSNLLNNAAKYTNAGGVVRLSAAIVEDALVVKVSDNGIGIAREHMEELFRMFSQITSAEERSEGGLGIGLALTKGLVELHGGTVAAESAGAGAGSTFTVTIPKALARAEQAEAGADAKRPMSASRRILVADDNTDAAESLAMLLRLDGHDVQLAHDGADAIRIFDSARPSVVLLDIGMPRLSGHEVAARIRQIDKEVLLVAITGWGQAHDRAKAQEAGFDHHLTKPVDYEQLSTLIHER